MAVKTEGERALVVVQVTTCRGGVYCGGHNTGRTSCYCYYLCQGHVVIGMCLLAGLHKNYLLIFTKFDGKVAHGPWKKQLDFDGNPDHLALELGLG